ncbi:HK97 family phage prohead protease [Rhodoligotrophos ferricapiens]|uniref:HK97 family phage prohead protease n=1 Tax=Rhodoligotrophos ferricapiens TaxID=3069264 RepID=UPI00315DD2E9
MIVDPSMMIEGYASVFGRADSAGDVVARGAFSASLARRRPAGIKMLFQHDPGQPIGLWTDIREDGYGLKVQGLLAEGVERAEEIARLVRLGALDGLSIGFRTLHAQRDRVTGMRLLTAIDLWEISIVTFPLLAEARLVTGPIASRPVQREGLSASAIRAAAQSFLTSPAANERTSR